jgi:hypothetical protein
MMFRATFRIVDSEHRNVSKAGSLRQRRPDASTRFPVSSIAFGKSFTAFRLRPRHAFYGIASDRVAVAEMFVSAERR